jgi:pyruvate dehydrogenase E2 component (dihydrolipoamide acetyltransferase)
VEFRLPDLGEGLEEAEIVEWLVAEGTVVKRDQPIVAVSTDKAVVELPSPVAGRLMERRGAPGDRLQVGEVIAVIGDDDSLVSAGVRARPRAAPTVRRLAAELGIDLTTVPAGPDGRIRADDVRRAAEAATLVVEEPRPAPPAEPPPPGPPPVRAVHPPKPSIGQAAPGRHPLVGIRRRTAEVMANAWANVPHIANMDEIDATALLDARRRLQDAAPEQAEVIGLLPLLVMATVQTLRRFPLVNAHLDATAGQIEVHAEINIGLAVATADGLVVPVVRHADRLELLALAAEIDRLVTAARSRTLHPAELDGATCTVTNFGSLGAGRFSTPIITPPQVAVVGFGRVAPRPLVVEEAIVARPTLPYTVAVDHRVLDGDVVSAFSAALVDRLTNPLSLLLG